MGQVDIQKLQQIVAVLAKRVSQLEDYARTLQQTLAKNNIKAPTLKGVPDDGKPG